MAETIDASAVIHSPDKISAPSTSNNLPTYSNGHDHAPTTAPQQKPILLVDSDTTAIAARQYLPKGWACAVYDPTVNTSLGSYTHAVIWGKNDEGGRAWSEAVADHLPIPCHVISLSRMPVHWHMDQPLPTGRTPAQLTGYLAAAIARCQQRQIVLTPAPTPVQVPPPAPAPVRLTLRQQAFTDLHFIRNGANNDGAIKPLMKNVATLLSANKHLWDLRFNEFSYRTCLGREYITDQDILAIALWVQECGVHAATGVIADAIQAVAGENKFHPVREYLDPLVWDGIPRLDMLFIDHAGTADTPLTRAITSKWFIQAVARIYQPGCQADGTLILEGVQGLRKSSFFRELFGDKWFTDHLPDIASKDALLQLRGVWCVEIGELATLGRAESAKIKQFLTSQVDRYRDPYGRVVADFPRTCVFSGSINPGAGGYLKDETGARRFWPLAVAEKINTGAVSQARDQLWAEALTRYRAREEWYLNTDSLTTAAQEITSERFTTDPWQEKIDAFLIGRAETSVEEIFKVALTITDIGKWTQADMNRITRCVSFSGWTRVRRGGSRSKRFVFVAPGEPGSAEVVASGHARQEEMI